MHGSYAGMAVGGLVGLFLLPLACYALVKHGQIKDEEGDDDDVEQGEDVADSVADSLDDEEELLVEEIKRSVSQIIGSDVGADEDITRGDVLDRIDVVLEEEEEE